MGGNCKALHRKGGPIINNHHQLTFNLIELMSCNEMERIRLNLNKWINYIELNGPSV